MPATPVTGKVCYMSFTTGRAMQGLTAVRSLTGWWYARYMCTSDCSVSVSEYEDQQVQTDPALRVPYTPFSEDKRTLLSKCSIAQSISTFARSPRNHQATLRVHKDAHFLRDLRYRGLRDPRPGHSRSHCICGSCAPYIAFAITPTHNTLIQDISYMGVTESRAEH